MALYRIQRQRAAAADVYRIGFADPAGNDEIVREVKSLLDEILEAEDVGGELALLNGPASLPVAVQLSHALCHRYASVGVFDPKLKAYVVAVSHSGDRRVGDLIPSDAVAE